MSANLTPLGITSAVVESRSHAALHRLDDFFVFHLDAMQAGADTALAQGCVPHVRDEGHSRSSDVEPSRMKASRGMNDPRSRTGAIHSSKDISGARPVNSNGPSFWRGKFGRLSFSDGNPTVVSNSGIETNFPSSANRRP